MNTEKQPCTNLASLIATHLDLIGPCTRLLALHSLPIGWYVTAWLRARRLALSLVESGEGYDDAERQLHRWKFHPAVAHDAVKWAHAEHLARRHGAAPSSLGELDHDPVEDAAVAGEPVAIATAPTEPLRGGVPVITRLAVPAPAGGDAA